MENKNLLNVRQLAESYAVDRDKMQDLLDKVGEQGVDHAGEKHYDRGAVAARLAEKDAATLATTAAVLDGVESDEAAQVILAEVLKGLVLATRARCSEPTQRLLEGAGRDLAGRVLRGNYRICAARVAVDRARTDVERTRAEWAWLDAIETYRSELYQAFVARRSARRQNRDTKTDKDEMR